MSKRIICIEGNIGSGKTTCIQSLGNLGYSVLEEPLDVWQTKYIEDDGTSIFELFYKDMKRWSFDFEVAVMCTRYKRLLEALKSDQDVVFIERSLFTDRKVFAINLRDIGKMTKMQWLIYEDWYDTFMSAIDHLIKQHSIEFMFINTPPEICFERKTGRGRVEEQDVVPDYFTQLHDKHCEWLLDVDLGFPIHVIDGSMSKEDIVTQITTLVKTTLV
jgi:deoxyadenosine/deoxycytidine kinase